MSQLQTLSSLLQTKRPEYYNQLNAPLTDADIDALEKKYQVQIPTNLRELYKWKNGQGDNCFEAFVNNSMFISLEEALETAMENNDMIGVDFDVEDWWNDKWIPIFHSGGGDYICYDCGGIFTGLHGQLIEFWHADSDRNIIAPSLDAFTESLIRYYQNTPKEAFDEFFEMEPIKGYPKRFSLE
jgi:cell wall assembly regulator SMI1